MNPGNSVKSNPKGMATILFRVRTVLIGILVSLVDILYITLNISCKKLYYNIVSIIDFLK